MTMSTGRIIALDVGSKRVGMAMADPLGLFAQPLGTFSPGEALEELKRCQEKEPLATVVVGWPLTEAGEEGWATDRVQEFINRIKKILPAVQLIKMDERYTSEMAREVIRSGAKPRMAGTSKGRLDTAAAGIILQDYLDEVRNR